MHYRDRNQITRLTNSTCTSDSNRLSPLVHAKTGDVIENFPINVRAIRELRGVLFSFFDPCTALIGLLV